MPVSPHPACGRPCLCLTSQGLLKNWAEWDLLLSLALQRIYTKKRFLKELLLFQTFLSSNTYISTSLDNNAKDTASKIPSLTNARIASTKRYVQQTKKTHFSIYNKQINWRKTYVGLKKQSFPSCEDYNWKNAGRLVHCYGLASHVHFNRITFVSYSMALRGYHSWVDVTKIVLGPLLSSVYAFNELKCIKARATATAFKPLWTGKARNPGANTSRIRISQLHLKHQLNPAHCFWQKALFKQRFCNFFETQQN